MAVSRRCKWSTTIGIIIVIIIAVIVGLVLGLGVFEENNLTSTRSFSIDIENDQFVMNGEPFQYVSGSFHYFRALPHVWQTRLRTMRSAGLNVIDTYVEWALHNPFDTVYDFDGIADLVQFLTLAQQEGLYVILRPGPYICAERDNGGIPYWLFNKYPNIQLRTSDPNYLSEVRLWYAQLMPKIQQFLYGNGGPIIMVQIENEYGVFQKCDREYLNWLRDETKQYVGDGAILFTVDIPNSVEEMRCGKIDDVFATTDFGIDRAHEMDQIWAMLRQVQPTGPLVNSEFYPGWLTHWQEANQRRDPDEVANALDKMLEAGASVNFYMFYGGTNFGFTAGANDWGFGNYMADITSYDYDAPMDEAGDPSTMKFIKIRDVIMKYLTIPLITVPDRAPKMTIDSLILKPIARLMSELGRQHLGRDYWSSTAISTPIESISLKSFEELNQFSGLVLYETVLPTFQVDPTVLTVNGLRDRAAVFIGDMYVGTLSRENGIDSLPLSSGWGTKLQILVENQGRINFNIADDKKGIMGPVTIQRFNGSKEELNQWAMTGFPLTKRDHLEGLISATRDQQVDVHPSGILLSGPVVFYTEFQLTQDEMFDTYLDTSGWGKGVLYVNGFNLGRYWPLAGPQITMYIPGDLLIRGTNNLVLIEYQKSPVDRTVRFSTTSRLDGV